MGTMKNLLADALARSLRYPEGAQSRHVAPRPAELERLAELGGPLPEEPGDLRRVLAMLDDVGSPATTINAGGRFFGFVNGGSLQAAVAADWLATAWDQNAGLTACSPSGNVNTGAIDPARAICEAARPREAWMHVDGEVLSTPRCASASRPGPRPTRMSTKASPRYCE